MLDRVPGGMDTIFHFRDQRLFALQRLRIPTGYEDSYLPKERYLFLYTRWNIKTWLVHRVSSPHRIIATRQHLRATSLQNQEIQVPISSTDSMYFSIPLSALFAAHILAAAVQSPPSPASVQGGIPECWEKADNATGGKRDAREVFTYFGSGQYRANSNHQRNGWIFIRHASRAIRGVALRRSRPFKEAFRNAGTKQTTRRVAREIPVSHSPDLGLEKANEATKDQWMAAYGACVHRILGQKEGGF